MKIEEIRNLCKPHYPQNINNPEMIEYHHNCKYLLSEYDRLTTKLEQLEAELAAYREAKQDGRLVMLICPIGTPIFRIYNTRGCENCTKKNIRCNGNECPDPKFYEDKFKYEHLAVIKDIKLTRKEAEAALSKPKEATNAT